jgi:tellurite resistance protein
VSLTQRTKGVLAKAAHVIENARLKLLSDEEKRALLAMFRGVSLADGVLAVSEHEALEDLASRLDLTLASVGELSLPAAVERLARSPRVLTFACLVVADAVFVDGEFGEAEKEFVTSFATRFGLSSNPMQAAVDVLRQQKLDAAITEWAESIPAV